MALTYSKPEQIGSQAPTFSLPGVDGRTYSLSDLLHGKKAVVVMFICNHCPYVIANHNRLMDMAKEYQEKGVSFVGINANDEKNYPADSFNNMVKLAQELNLPFPYLRDQDQSVAKKYDAVCTPEVYIVDSTNIIRYHGGIDDNWKDANQATKHYLRNAIEDILAGRNVKEATPHAMGCSIKWSS